MSEKKSFPAVLHSPRTRKNGWRALWVFFAIGVLGFFVLPPIVKSVLLEKLTEALHRPVTVERIRINPYRLTLQIDGLAIEEKGGGEKVAGFDSLYVNLEAVSLLRGGPVISEIRLDAPRLKVVRLADNRYNFSDLLDALVAKPASDSPTPLPSFSLSNIQITGGVLEFDDRPLKEVHLVNEIRLGLPFVSSLPYATDTFVEPAFSSVVNGAPFALSGKGKPFADSYESEMTLRIDHLQLAKYLDYLPFPLPIKVGSGALSSDLRFVFRQHKNSPAALTVAGNAALHGLQVSESAGAPLLAVKRLDLDLGTSDLRKRHFVVNRLAIESPEVHAQVTRDGVLNWLSMLPPPSRAAASPAVDKPAAAVLAWSLAEASIRNGALHWLDESRGKPLRASVDGITLDLQKLDSTAASAAEFAAAWRIDAGEWLKVDAFSIKGGRIALAQRELSLGEVAATGVRGLLRRSPTGAVVWLEPPLMRAVEASQQDTAAPWKVTIADYRGDNVGLRFEDQAVSPAVTHTVEGLGFEIANLSTESGQKARVTSRFRFNRKGTVEIGGELTPKPFGASLKLDVKTLELLPLQPYFTDKLNVDIARGLLTLGGELQLRQETAAVDGSVPGLAGGFTGQVTLGDFHALDKTNSADLLKWKSLYLGNLDLRLNPNSVAIGELALSEFFARVIVSPEGRLNLLQLVRKEDVPVASAVAGKKDGEDGGAAVAGASPAESEAPVTRARAVLPMKIGKVTLQGGNIRFSDNFVKPNYAAHLKQIGGRVTGLSSAADSVAEVELRGSYDSVAPLLITGRINPLAAKPYLDLQAEVKGVELTSLSPYAAKYAGYAIDKGKLSLFVKYRIENNQLEAENRVFLDQLTFGEAVDSPDATKLPVNLAVSLLKNRNGVIDINLPISGSLDDPQFSVGGLVIQVIVNLLTKALTSPFALLGSVFGGSGEISNIEFSYGQAAIDEAAGKRLENLAKALIDRPALKLEVEGRVESERDREGLKVYRIDRKVKALKREALVSGGAESVPLSSIEVTTEEYPELLEKVYRAEKFPKPRNLVGMIKALPVAEMQKLMLANAPVDEDDLRALGERRAKAVRDWLIAHEVPVERVFLLPAKLIDVASESADKVRESRVDFSLK